jgi:hypothetical protein
VYLLSNNFSKTTFSCLEKFFKMQQSPNILWYYKIIAKKTFGEEGRKVSGQREGRDQKVGKDY